MSAIRNQRVLARLEGENSEEKIEVVVREMAEGSPLLEIRSLCWGQGVGWYVQKTITLDAIQLKMLAHVLRRVPVARAKRAGNGKVIPFPAR